MSTKQRRPNAFLYLVCGFFMKLHCLIKYKLKLTGPVPKGPAVILSNHTSNYDHHIVPSAAYPNRINFLCSYHWFTFKKLRPWLNIIGAIPKLQFATDLSSMRRIKSVIDNKGIVWIAPEGTVYANGKLGFISPSISKFVKYLKVPVYTFKIQGQGLGNAKWSKHKHYPFVSVERKEIINSEEILTLSKEVIYSRIVENLKYDEFEFQKQNNVTITSNDKAEGFETMFYKCPSCNSEFTLTSQGNSITCTNCKANAVINDSFRFDWNGDKQYFDNYLQWYDWQFDCLKKEMQDESFVLEDEVDYAIDMPGKNNYTKVGHGIMRLDKTGWHYKGTYQDKVIEEYDEIQKVPLATLKIGIHFELPYKDGHCRVFYPSNGLTSMKWHLASRVLLEKNEINPD